MKSLKLVLLGEDGTKLLQCYKSKTIIQDTFETNALKLLEETDKTQMNQPSMKRYSKYIRKILVMDLHTTNFQIISLKQTMKSSN